MSHIIHTVENEFVLLIYNLSHWTKTNGWLMITYILFIVLFMFASFNINII